MEFITIEKQVEAQIAEKKSKFIANFFPVESVIDAEAVIKEIKKKYYDARHNCIAYRVMEDDQIIEKSSDDGEPSGTAVERYWRAFWNSRSTNACYSTKK